MEFERRFERRAERNENLERLRRHIEQIVVPGAGKTELEELLAVEPQRDSNDVLRYLVTSGMAVELITGYQREHHDLDLVIMDSSNTNRWEVYGTDNVTPQQYWADMKFDPRFLEDTVRQAKLKKERKNSPLVEVVHPAILLVQKSSNAFGRPPREKDGADVAAIVDYWQTVEDKSREWDEIMRESLRALPVHQREVTVARLKKVIG